MPLNMFMSEILVVMQRKCTVNWSKAMRFSAEARNKDKWYRFPKDHRYDMEDYVQMKWEIERLLEEGHLKEYIQVSKPRRDKEKESEKKIPTRTIDIPYEETRGVFNMIIGGESIGGESLGKGKAYARKVYSVKTSRDPQQQPITFIAEDGKGVSYLHNDPIVVVINIDGFILKRIMVDSGSSCTILT